MQDKVKKENSTPILLPMAVDEFLENIRTIVQEELENLKLPAARTGSSPSSLSTPGLTQKPLFKIAELCELFQVTKPTIYDWIDHGKLKPLKIRSRVFFLWQDVQQLIRDSQQEDTHSSGQFFEG